MKIRKNAALDPWTRDVTCDQCRSELTVDNGDVGYDGGQDYPIARRSGYYVRCPVCKHMLFLNERGIPHLLKEVARQRRNL